MPLTERVTVLILSKMPYLRVRHGIGLLHILYPRLEQLCGNLHTDVTCKYMKKITYKHINIASNIY
jgi:hypothetical protein